MRAEGETDGRPVADPPRASRPPSGCVYDTAACT